MKLKPGVRLRGTRPELCVAMMVAEDVFERVCHRLALGDVEFTLTSVADGTHVEKASLHYTGDAFDFRVHDLRDPIEKASMRAEVEVALGPDFDVLLENPGTDNEHIHVEYQPKSI